MGSDPLLSEKQVLDKYPVLSAHVLKKARKDETIAWARGKWKSPWYRVSAVETFIRSLEKCPALAPAPSSNSPDNGSRKTQGRPISIDFGQNQELVEHAARHLAQRI